MPDNPPNLGSRGSPLIAAALLLAALALVVLYTGRPAFLSPVALVVVAAIGVAALLLRLRLRPEISSTAASSTRSSRIPVLLNALGVACAVVAIFADVLHLSVAVLMVAALAGVVSFGASGIIVLASLRKRRM